MDRCEICTDEAEAQIRRSEECTLDACLEVYHLHVQLAHKLVLLLKYGAASTSQWEKLFGQYDME